MVYGVASGAEGDRLKNKKQKQANPQQNLTIFVLTHRPTLIFQWFTTCEPLAYAQAFQVASVSSLRTCSEVSLGQEG